MRMSIAELITFCEKKEYNHRLNCKRYDDASGYTRSRIEEIRTNDAKREEKDSKFYNELKKIVRKYQKIEEIVTQWQNETDPKIKFARSNIEKIKEVIEDGNDN